MIVDKINYVDTDPWAWHVMHEELIGARKDRVTVLVYDAVSYHKETAGPSRTHPEHHGRRFDTLAEAAAYLEEHGLIRPEQPGDWKRPSAAMKSMRHPQDEEGYQAWLDFGQALREGIAQGGILR